MTIFIDALSYLWSAFFVSRIQRQEAPLPARAGRRVAPGQRLRAFGAEIGAGLRYVTGHRYLANIALCTGTANLFGNIMFTLLLLYEVRFLGLAPGVIGLIGFFAALGALLGGFTATSLAAPFRRGPHHRGRGLHRRPGDAARAASRPPASWRRSSSP